MNNEYEAVIKNDSKKSSISADMKMNTNSQNLKEIISKSQIDSFSINNSKKNKYIGNSKLSSFRQQINSKYKTSKCSPEKSIKIKQNNELVNNVNNSNIINIQSQKEIDSNGDDFIKTNIIKKQSKHKNKSNLNFSNPIINDIGNNKNIFNNYQNIAINNNVNQKNIFFYKNLNNNIYVNYTSNQHFNIINPITTNTTTSNNKNNPIGQQTLIKPQLQQDNNINNNFLLNNNPFNINFNTNNSATNQLYNSNKNNMLHNDRSNNNKNEINLDKSKLLFQLQRQKINYTMPDANKNSKKKSIEKKLTAKNSTNNTYNLNNESNFHNEQNSQTFNLVKSFIHKNNSTKNSTINNLSSLQHISSHKSNKLFNFNNNSNSNCCNVYNIKISRQNKLNKESFSLKNNSINHHNFLENKYSVPFTSNTINSHLTSTNSPNRFQINVKKMKNQSSKNNKKSITNIEKYIESNHNKNINYKQEFLNNIINNTFHKTKGINKSSSLSINKKNNINKDRNFSLSNNMNMNYYYNSNFNTNYNRSKSNKHNKYSKNIDNTKIDIRKSYFNKISKNISKSQSSSIEKNLNGPFNNINYNASLSKKINNLKANNNTNINNFTNHNMLIIHNSMDNNVHKHSNTNNNDNTINIDRKSYNKNNDNIKYSVNNNANEIITPINIPLTSKSNSKTKLIKNVGKGTKNFNLLNLKQELKIAHKIFNEINNNNSKTQSNNKNSTNTNIIYNINCNNLINNFIDNRENTNNKESKGYQKNTSPQLLKNNNSCCNIISTTEKKISSLKKKIISISNNNVNSDKNNEDNLINNNDTNKNNYNINKLENIIENNHHNLTNLDISTCSNKSILLKDGNYYKNEAEKLSNYIKHYYYKYREYPKTKISFYKFGRLIGRGAFGKVNLGLHIISGKIVAIKSLNKTKLKKEESKLKIYQEINLMKNLRHNSIVKILETLETEKYILIIMENISGGDLLNFIKKRTKLPEKISKIIFIQLILSIKYLHSQNIIHRDIKLDNILIDLNNTIKLCDFGISKKINGSSDLLKDPCGTPAYIAPEILSNENGYEGYPVDLWSSGVVLYAMLSGTVPFKANNPKDLQKIIIKGNFSEIKEISKEANNLIHSLLEVNPKKRITVDQVLNHPWLNEVYDYNCKFSNNLNFNYYNNLNNGSFFTKAEYILLSKANADYINGNKDDLIENFTLKNLNTDNDKETKNIKSKSIILAPFNSSIESSNNNSNFYHNYKKNNFSLRNKGSLNSEVFNTFNDLNIENEVMKFNTKTKELNRNYELNNNGEIDHGILINHSNQNSNNNDNEENLKDKLINDKINNDNINNLNNFDKGKNNECKKNINNNSPFLKDFLLMNNNNNSRGNSKDNSNRKNKDTDRVFINNFIIDEDILKQIDSLGYHKDYLKKCLNNNELNYATSTYFLLEKYKSYSNYKNINS